MASGAAAVASISRNPEAVWLCLIAGITRALEDLIHDLSPDGAILDAARSAAHVHIANLEPPATPIDEQAIVVAQAMELFEEVFLTALARAIVRQAARVERGASRDPTLRDSRKVPCTGPTTKRKRGPAVN